MGKAASRRAHSRNAKGERHRRLRWCGSGDVKGGERGGGAQRRQKGKEEERFRREGEGVEEATIEVNSHLNLERVPRVAGLEDFLYKCNVGGRERLNCLRSLSRWATRSLDILLDTPKTELATKLPS